MMQPVHRVNGEGACALRGRVVRDWGKSFWTLGMTASALFFAPFTFTLSAFVLFLVLTYFSLLIGHSAGMHRMMIHRTFKCGPVVEKLLIYVGVLVGMSGPYGIIRIHDTRDWAQRQEKCHSFFSHKQSYWRDVWWQLTSRFVFERSPVVTIEPHYANDVFYRWLEKTWRFHQIPLAVLLYVAGGWSFVVWGVLVRIAVSIIGHWSITHFCHNPGPGRWKVTNVGVQASNIPGLGLITYGECWHNNHHAFPESAQIGLEHHQSDPAFNFIKLLERAGLATDIGLPRLESERDDLVSLVDAEYSVEPSAASDATR